MCAGSPLSVRELPTFQERMNQNVYQQTSCKYAAMRQRQSDDLAVCQRGGSVLCDDLVALLTIACEAKEWIVTYALKR